MYSVQRKTDGGFTLIELLVVIFILVTVAFVSFPKIWTHTTTKETVAIGVFLKALREEALSTKRSTELNINFKERFFLLKGSKGEKIIKMQDDERWELYVPSRGLIKDGEVKVLFPPTISEEFIALYLSKGEKDYTVTLNNLTGEVTVEEGRKNFSE